MNTLKCTFILPVFIFAGTILQAMETGQTNNDELQSGIEVQTNQRRPFLQEKMYPVDLFMITLFTDLWHDLPGDMDLKSIQRGITISAFQDMPLGRTNFSLAAGLGFTSHNLYSDHRYVYHPGEDTFDFFPISDDDYDKNKISLNYIEIPVQFRYRSRHLPRTVRLYAGMKAGWLINAHTKYVGKEFYHLVYDKDDESTTTVTSRKVKTKEHKPGNIANYLIGLTGTIGYGNVNLYFYYPLTGIFTENSAEDARPLSLGLTFILF
jgi:hypothetical protein